MAVDPLDGAKVGGQKPHHVDGKTDLLDNAAALSVNPDSEMFP